jgi:hypothetical protein
MPLDIHNKKTRPFAVIGFFAMKPNTTMKKMTIGKQK